MENRENAYAREEASQQLKEIQLNIARLEARTNRQPDEDKHLRELHKQYEALKSQFEENNMDLAA